MPADWQRRFVVMLDEIRDAFGHLASDQPYEVNLEGGEEDPLKDYWRGRRRLEPAKPPERP
jgi:hypothetical protein